MRAVALAVSLSILLAGCAEEAAFRSAPSAAKVYLNDQFVGLTPLDYPIPKSQVKSTWNYRIESDGYEPDNGSLHRRRRTCAPNTSSTAARGKSCAGAPLMT